MTPKIFIVAGEASADMHAASLLKELKDLSPLQAFGVGGDFLAKEGMEIVVRSESLNIVATEFFDRAGELWRSYQKVKASIRERKPDFAILLDLPDFNLKIASYLKQLGIPVIYYISPQVWAWRKSRVKLIRKRVSKMIVVFPFEKDFYEKQGVEVAFHGHPLVESLGMKTLHRTQDEILNAPRVAILPGSRLSELAHHGPILKEVTRLLRSEFKTIELKVPVSPTLSVKKVEEALGKEVSIERLSSEGVFHWADCAVVASGTASLEAALVGVPFTILFRANWPTTFFLKNVFRYRGYFGMPNVLLKKEAVKEFVHEKASPQSIFEELKNLITDKNYRDGRLSATDECRSLLGTQGASRRVAEDITQFVRQTHGGNLAFSPQGA